MCLVAFIFQMLDELKMFRVLRLCWNLYKISLLYYYMKSVFHFECCVFINTVTTVYDLAYSCYIWSKICHLKFRIRTYTFLWINHTNHQWFIEWKIFILYFQLWNRTFPRCCVYITSRTYINHNHSANNPSFNFNIKPNLKPSLYNKNE